MRKAYAQTQSLLLAIDGLQPEKGHETLYVVRELTQKRVWFAEPLLSSTNDEVRRVLARAGQIAGAGASCAAGHVALEPSPAGQVVWDYCAAVRGILNDDQGGPLHPPGPRMADALAEVRESLERNLGAKKGGPQSSNCSV